MEKAIRKSSQSHHLAIPTTPQLSHHPNLRTWIVNQHLAFAWDVDVSFVVTIVVGFIFCSGIIPGDAHRFLLALYSGISPGRLGGPIGCLE